MIIPLVVIHIVAQITRLSLC